MVQSIGGIGSIFALLLSGLIAVPASAGAPPKKEPVKKPGVLHVYDGGSLFSDGAIDRAKVSLGKMQFERETTLTVDTHASVPKDKTLPGEPGERAQFFENWARSAAASDKAKGVYVLVCRSPGYVAVIVDKATRDRGFSNENERRTRDMLLTSFKDAAQAKKDGKSDEDALKIRDKGLLNAVEYVSGVLKGTTK